MALFSPLSAEIRTLVDTIPSLIDKVFPLPRQFRHKLPDDIAELSHLLTNDRGSRTFSYLGKPAFLSAYMRYFLPWNVFRLCRLLSSLPLNLNADDAVVDLGSGPLTFVIALWIAKPDLRNIPLEFRCIDHTRTVLDAGKKLFFALTGAYPAQEGVKGVEKTAVKTPWTIKTIKGDINAPVHGKKAALVATVNVFNEIFQSIPHTVSLREEAEKIARRLAFLAPQVLVVEPGIPRSGEFISALRASLITEGFDPLSPCPHAGVCPLAAAHAAAHAGTKAKWCHFAFDTLDAPEPLLKLSAAAGFPKERAALSFLLAKAALHRDAIKTSPHVRILSDSFTVPSRSAHKPLFGRYGCSEKGLVLVQGEENAAGQISAGTLLPLTFSKPEKRDRKTNALIAEFTKM
jgi:ribosomal protein RSM22 (predicted rRNA methylase)